ncbi:MAG: methyltransferase domain-containing protein [Clostridia bacterium]|nr:methyltransferase domain-containing protein [Clostridia bacterium]
MAFTDILRCPLCGAGLERKENSLYCTGERRHCYDIASSGYVNLLPPGRGRNARTGDDREMMKSRGAFLDRGCYGRISDRIASIISAYAESARKPCITVADCACGEGYHTCRILKALAEKRVRTEVFGFDASKYGVSCGAKRSKKPDLFSDCSSGAYFAAANIFSLPVYGGSFDFALSLFAPIAGDEMTRILKDDGKLIVASAGAHHLYELRCALYDDVRLSSGTVRCPDGFVRDREETVSYRENLDKDSLLELYLMTPFSRKTSFADEAKLGKTDGLDVTVEVKITVFSKKGRTDI